MELQSTVALGDAAWQLDQRGDRAAAALVHHTAKLAQRVVAAVRVCVCVCRRCIYREAERQRAETDVALSGGTEKARVRGGWCQCTRPLKVKSTWLSHAGCCLTVWRRRR